MSKKGSYPTDPSYHQQQYQQQQYQQQQYQQQPLAPNAPMGAPPPYSQLPPTYTAGVPGPGQPYPVANPNMMVTGPGGPAYGYGPYNYQPPQAGYQPPANPGYPVQQGFNYAQPPVAVAHFDSGARFDGIASQNVPPPPPGCAPNAAQMAAAQGGTWVPQQQKAGWLSGGSGGGTSFW